jgi:hypothetical protein
LGLGHPRPGEARLITDFALDFIRRHRDKPFFLYLAYTVPHFNLEVPGLAPYGDKDWPEESKIFAAMVTRLDRGAQGSASASRSSTSLKIRLKNTTSRIHTRTWLPDSKYT